MQKWRNNNLPHLANIWLLSARPERERIVVFCSWVTPDTKITHCAKQLVDVDSKLFQGAPQRELFKMGEKSFMQDKPNHIYLEDLARKSQPLCCF